MGGFDSLPLVLQYIRVDTHHFIMIKYKIIKHQLLILFHPMNRVIHALGRFISGYFGIGVRCHLKGNTALKGSSYSCDFIITVLVTFLDDFNENQYFRK